MSVRGCDAVLGVCIELVEIACPVYKSPISECSHSLAFTRRLGIDCGMFALPRCESLQGI